MSRVTAMIANSLNETELTLLRKRQLELHCITMKLERKGANARVFNGSGSIKQNAEGELLFVLYSSDKVPMYSAIKEILGNNRNQAGKIIPEEEYFTLEATDIEGRIWKSRNIIPDNHSSGIGTVCRGELFEIIAESEPNEKIKIEEMIIEYPYEGSIPFNKYRQHKTIVNGKEMVGSISNYLSFNYGGYEIEIDKVERDKLVIELNGRGTAIKKYLELRISEALQFVLATPMKWYYLQRASSIGNIICIRSIKYTNTHSRVGPPISITPELVDSFCTLFCKYLDYILIDPNEDKYNAISIQMRSICQASEGSIEAKALAISIAVEALVKLVIKSPARLSDEEKEWITRAREYFLSWEGPANITKRILGLFSLLHTLGASRQLAELIENKVITLEEKKAWDDIRNKLAHGNSLGSEPIQEFVNKSNTSIVLFYKLVFTIIGYRGKYCDYSTIGWPEKIY